MIKDKSWRVDPTSFEYVINENDEAVCEAWGDSDDEIANRAHFIATALDGYKLLKKYSRMKYQCWFSGSDGFRQREDIDCCAACGGETKCEPDCDIATYFKRAEDNG